MAVLIGVRRTDEAATSRFRSNAGRPDTSVEGLSHDDAPLSFENHHSDLYQHSPVDSIALIPTLDDEHVRYLVLLHCNFARMFRMMK
jgi:hypothetical protein